MKKQLIIGGTVVGAVLLARRCASCAAEQFDFEQMIERMPDNAPPQVDVPQHQRDPREHRPDPGAARTGELARRGRAGTHGLAEERGSRSRNGRPSRPYVEAVRNPGDSTGSTRSTTSTFATSGCGTWSRSCSARAFRPARRRRTSSCPSTDGTRVRLSHLRGQPVLLHFVSYTCPVTRGGVYTMRELHRLYGERVEFVEVLVRQAHPGERHGAYGSYEEKLEDARALRTEERLHLAGADR